tara:strand:- start:732 stop:1817 length:1086 start_codon:yes stop_codon:yes gene_type:complete
MNTEEEKLIEALKTIEVPYLNSNLVDLESIKEIAFSDNTWTIELEFGFPIKTYKATVEKSIVEKLKDVVEHELRINIKQKIEARSVQKGTKPLKEIKNVIAVASGKGGVGKSTTTANLAIALEQEGAKVGVLDADIYGPSQTKMLGSQGKPDTRDGKKMLPIISYNIQTISIGNLVEEDTPMIWRGPMVTGALEQLLNETAWDNLDYLLVDLPPGTGDIQLTLCQKIPVSGAVIVTTPQDIALLDAKKALKMFEKVNVSVLGIIENMSMYKCSQCGHIEHIFGSDGGSTMAKQYGVDLLGKLPLDIDIRKNADGGRPTTAFQPDSEIALDYREIGMKMTAKLSLKAKDHSSKFPNIVVQNT